MEETKNMNYPDDFINKIIHGDCLEVMKCIPDNSIDFIFTAAVFIHTPLDVTRRYLEQTHDKLKSGGRFLHHFNVCSLDEGLHKIMWHVFTEEELDKMFEGVPLECLNQFDNKCYAKKQWMRYIYGVK